MHGSSAPRGGRTSSGLLRAEKTGCAPSQKNCAAAQRQLAMMAQRQLAMVAQRQLAIVFRLTSQAAAACTRLKRSCAMRMPHSRSL